MKTYKKITVEQYSAETITCDICGKKYDYANSEDFMEIQEFHHINFRGGYNSVFGDDVGFAADICQHCLKEKLGEYIKAVDIIE